VAGDSGKGKGDAARSGGKRKGDKPVGGEEKKRRISPSAGKRAIAFVEVKGVHRGKKGGEKTPESQCDEFLEKENKRKSGIEKRSARNWVEKRKRREPLLARFHVGKRKRLANVIGKENRGGGRPMSSKGYCYGAGRIEEVRKESFQKGGGKTEKKKKDRTPNEAGNQLNQEEKKEGERGFLVKEGKKESSGMAGGKKKSFAEIVAPFVNRRVSAFRQRGGGMLEKGKGDFFFQRALRSKGTQVSTLRKKGG